MLLDPASWQVQQERLVSWFKQRNSSWLTAWAYVFCTTLLRLPFSLANAAAWACIVYYTTGLTPELSRFSTTKKKLSFHRQTQQTQGLGPHSCNY